MDENVQEGFDMIKQRWLELSALVIARNEIAKWSKRNAVEPKLMPN